MLIRDTVAGYGLLTRLTHWVMAVGILGMFALGLWMVTLTYYSPYYRSAPDIHRSVGILLLILLVLRFLWRLANPKPDDSELAPWERTAARIVHWGFYPLLLALMVSGYLISTADGRPIEVFDWFSVPSLVQKKGMEDVCGRGSRDPRLSDDRRRGASCRRLPEAPLHRPQPHSDAHVVGSTLSLVLNPARTC